MKKLLFLLALLAGMSAKSQSKITIASGVITIDGTAHSVSDVSYNANYSNGVIEFYSRYGPVRYLQPTAPTAIINGTTSQLFASMDDIISYLAAGYNTGGSGGGSANIYPGSDYAKSTPTYRTYTNVTATLTGSTQQLLASGNRGTFIQNLATTPLTINFTAGATTTTVTLQQYAVFDGYTTQAINILGTASAAYIAYTY